MSWTLKVSGCVVLTTQTYSSVFPRSYHLPQKRSTAEPPLSETKILRAVKAADYPAPTSARQHIVSTSAGTPSFKAAYFGRSNSHPASPNFSVGGTGLTEGCDERTTEALTIWEKQLRSRQATWLGLDPQQHFTSAFSPTLWALQTKDTAFSKKEENLHQPSHQTPKNTICSTKQLGEDDEEFRHGLHKAKMRNAWKTVWEDRGWTLPQKTQALVGAWGIAVMLEATRPAVRPTSSYLHFADGGRYYTHLLRLPQKHGIGGCMKTKIVTCFIYADIYMYISHYILDF